jgi:predicted kinase
VHDARAARAAAAGAAGHAAIVDAVFHDPTQRAQIEDVAATAGVPFSGLWLSAPLAVLVERVAERRGDVSDATPEVVRRQLAIDPGAMSWRPLDASGSSEGVAVAARTLLA